jgi:hypothetical protein
MRTNFCWGCASDGYISKHYRSSHMLDNVHRHTKWCQPHDIGTLSEGTKSDLEYFDSVAVTNPRCTLTLLLKGF